MWFVALRLNQRRFCTSWWGAVPRLWHPNGYVTNGRPARCNQTLPSLLQSFTVAEISFPTVENRFSLLQEADGSDFPESFILLSNGRHRHQECTYLIRWTSLTPTGQGRMYIHNLGITRLVRLQRPNTTPFVLSFLKQMEVLRQSIAPVRTRWHRLSVFKTMHWKMMVCSFQTSPLL